MGIVIGILIIIFVGPLVAILGAIFAKGVLTHDYRRVSSTTEKVMDKFNGLVQWIATALWWCTKLFLILFVIGLIFYLLGAI